MIFFLKYFKIINFNLFGSQNVISNNKKLLFNNSGISSIKNLLFKSLKKKIATYQNCIRIKGIFNDICLNNNGIHKICFIMLGIFSNKIKLNYLFLKIKIFLFFFKKIKKKNVFFSVNIINYSTIIILLLSKINIKNIFFTKKNIWKINNNGIIGFCLELYYKFNNKMLEICNIVNINFLNYNNKIFKLKNNIIDIGIGYSRINLINFKINLKLNDICNTIFLIVNNINLNFTKNHNFLLNKIIKILFNLIFFKKINVFKIFVFFFKKNKNFFLKINLYKFINYIINKEYVFYLNLKKINIKKNNFITIIDFFKTFGVSYKILYLIIKKNFK
ncbi:MAG: alanine--tRNA ligase-related protein [Candidatus Carsonella ruddii]